MIEMKDAMRVIQKQRQGDIVVTTETSVLAWEELSEAESQDETLDLPMPAMSKGSSMALGVALAQPDRRVILWDGDGSLLMNLGSMVSIGGKSPSNFYHIVLDNRIYAMTGGQPVPNAEKLDWETIAKGAGYTCSYQFDNLEDWTTGIGEALSQTGPVLIVMSTGPRLTDWRNDPPNERRNMTDAAQIAIKALS